MTTEQIVQWVISAIPSVIAVISTVGLILKVVKDFKNLRNDVANMTSMQELRDELKMVLEENRALKKQLNKTMTSIDHIRREDVQ